MMVPVKLLYIVWEIKPYNFLVKSNEEVYNPMRTGEQGNSQGKMTENI